MNLTATAPSNLSESAFAERVASDTSDALLHERDTLARCYTREVLNGDPVGIASGIGWRFRTVDAEIGRRFPTA